VGCRRRTRRRGRRRRPATPRTRQLGREGAPGVGHADVDALSRNGKGAVTADPPLDSYGFRCGLQWWPGGAGVADAGLFGGGQRVGQAAQQDTVGDELQQAPIEANCQAPAGEVGSRWGVARWPCQSGRPSHLCHLFGRWASAESLVAE
jgi:hypothetical protein